MLKQNPLRSPVPFPKRVNHVQIAKQLGAGRNQAPPIQLLKPVRLRQYLEQPVGFGFYAVGHAEVGLVFGDVDGTQFARPVVEIGEQLTVDGLQVGQVVGGRGEVDGLSGNFGKVALGLRQGFCVSEVNARPSDALTWF